MTRAAHPDGTEPAGTDPGRTVALPAGAGTAGPVAPAGTDAAELVAQIRQLAGADPAGVRQVVADVLGALDRAAGGALRDQLPEALSFDALVGEALGSPVDASGSVADRSTSAS